MDNSLDDSWIWSNVSPKNSWILDKLTPTKKCGSPVVGKDYQVITPETATIDINKTFYIIEDHVPDIENFFDSIDLISTIKNANSIIFYFTFNNVDYRKKVFIFDHYLGFEGFEKNGYFFPYMFLQDLADF